MVRSMTGKMTAPAWVRVQAAADHLGVSPSTLRRWVADGRIACQRTPSGQRRFLLEDLDRSLRGEAPPSPDAHSADDRQYKLLYETSRELNSSLEPTEVLQSAARRLTAALRIRDCDIYRLDRERLVCLASTIDGTYDDSWVGQEISLQDWHCKRLAIETRRAVAVGSLDDPRLSPVERENLRHYGQQSCMSLPLVARDKVIGLVGLLDHVERQFTDEEIAVAEAVGQLVALALEHAELYGEVKRLHLGNLRALSSALSAKDYYTLGHASRVAAYTAMLGRELGWSEEGLAEVENVAFLHDIGKIGVSDRVLLKAGPLTSEEWELVRQHPGISAEIVRPLFEPGLVDGVRHHHERFDGRGYPDGLAGTEIPLLARALCVVDCYDAMSSDRPYRHGLTYEQCLSELEHCAGTQFDPEMVEAFTRVLRELERRRTRVDALAAEAAALVDPSAHDLLRTASDEARPEYAQMVASMRELRDASPPVRYITSFAMRGEQCISVLDTGESEREISHIGDPWLPHDELAAVLAGQSPATNALNADDFGVWITGLAPVLDAAGAVAAAVTVDVPAIEWAPELQSEQAHTLAAMLQAAAIRYSRAEVEAITDGLTGLYNHRYLHERLEEELERCRRRGSELAVLFCDCDDFKVFNDTHGHKGGDAALARIARVIESAGRSVDLAARYGGDEFVLVLIDTDDAGALAVAERLRCEVQGVNASEVHPLTVSVGVAAFPADATAKDELLDKADWAMYAAKRAGRNRVLAFSDGLVREETWLSRHGR